MGQYFKVIWKLQICFFPLHGWWHLAKWWRFLPNIRRPKRHEDLLEIHHVTSGSRFGGWHQNFNKNLWKANDYTYPVIFWGFWLFWSSAPHLVGQITSSLATRSSLPKKNHRGSHFPSSFLRFPTWIPSWKTTPARQTPTNGPLKPCDSHEIGQMMWLTHVFLVNNLVPFIAIYSPDMALFVEESKYKFQHG